MFERLLQMRSQALEYNNSGHKKYLQVDFNGALTDYNTAIDLDPNLAVAYYNRGTVHYRLGSFQIAIRDLSKAVQLDPLNNEFIQGLKDCQEMCKQLEN